MKKRFYFGLTMFMILVLALSLAGCGGGGTPPPPGGTPPPPSYTEEPVSAPATNYSAQFLSIAADGDTLYAAFRATTASNKTYLFKNENDGTGWVQVGSTEVFGTANATSVAFYNRIPYVAYIENNTMKASVKRLNGGAWEQVGSAEFSGEAVSFSFAIDSAGTPYVAYAHRIDNGAGGWIYKTTVMKFDIVSGDWVNVGAADFATTVQTTGLQLAIDGSTPYIAYSDSDNGNRLTIRRYNSGSNSWEAVGGTGITASNIGLLSFFAESGNLYVACTDPARNISVMKYNGSWTSLGNVGGGAYTLSLYVYNGTPFVAYLDSTASYYGTIKYLNGSNWDYVGGAAGVTNTGVEEFVLTGNGSTLLAAYIKGSDRKVYMMKFAPQN